MRPTSRQRTTTRRTSEAGSILVIVLVALAALAAAWRFGLFDGLLGGQEEVAIEGAPVRRGDLRISEVVRGNLEATDSVSLKSEVEGRSTIIYLIDEGTKVEPGDLVCELDVSQLEDDLVRQEIEVKNAEASFTKAREQYDIQVIQNESDIASAELSLDLARLDLAKYVGDPEAGEPGEWDNELASAQETRVLREEDLATAVKELDWAVKLHAEKFISENELESKRLARQRSEIQLDQANRDLSLKIKYGNRRRLAELQAAVDTAGRDVEKVKKQASARLADYEAARESARYKLVREQQQLEELREQVGNAKIFAPVPGLVVYARERSRWGGGDSVEEGQEVRERQEIVTIPREGGMTVQASIHETKLKKIQVGQTCIVTVDAFPGRTFPGRVDFVAVMADSGSWRSNPNQRLYKADISLVETTPEMRPGMSCNVEILVEDLEDVHYVPRQCVFLDGGEPIVFAKEGAEAVRREVEVGLDNTKWVAILNGVEEDEIVLLAPPANFKPAPIPDEEAPSIEGAGPPRRPSSDGAERGGTEARAQPAAAEQRGRPQGNYTEEQRAEFMKRLTPEQREAIMKRMREGGGFSGGGSGGAGK
ncbi:MAG: efflux RND transporter periplasmic adaptor subunit [Planctomycetota bacterium]